MRAVALDLETVPCLETARRYWGVNPDAPDAYDEIAAIRFHESKGKDEFLKPFMQRVVAVGLVGMDLDKGTVKIAAEAHPNEGQMLALVDAWLWQGPVLVSWNGLGFDLSVLRYRALFHGLAMPNLYRGFKAWEKYDYRFGDQHYDLMDVLSGFGRSTSLKLAEAAALCDLPCKTTTDGGYVLELWKRRSLTAIEAYVQEDTRVTARLFLRWMVTRGRLTSKQMDALDGQLLSARELELERVPA